MSAEGSRVQTGVLVLFLQLLLELFHGLPGLTQVVKQGAVGLLHAGLLLCFVFGIGGLCLVFPTIRRMFFA